MLPEGNDEQENLRDRLIDYEKRGVENHSPFDQLT